jgi:D-alanyl-D-alanine carboxypeptidase
VEINKKRGEIMNYKKMVAAVAVLFMFLHFAVTGFCEGDGKVTREQWTENIKHRSQQGAVFNQADLQNILDAEWQAYSRDKTNFGGGIAMQFLTPSGSYFISTGMGSGMDHSHRFRTASVTKTFTAASIMLLHKRGRLNINHKLSDCIPGTEMPYFPYNIPHRNEITIKMILMHRAGIFDLTNTDIQDNAASHSETYVGKNYIEEAMKPPNEKHPFTFDELFRVIEKNKQVGFKPTDSKYAYSDTGYTILGYIVEKVSGKSYSEFVCDEFLLPNGLSNSSFPQGTDGTLPAPFVHGYSWDGSKLKDVTDDNMSAFVGNGNMITTPFDLATWAKKLMTGQTALNMKTVEQMKAGLPTGPTSSNTYGLGIKYSPQLGYGHEGDHKGYTTFMFYKPEQDIAYVAFMNIWDESNIPASYAAQKKFLATTVLKVFARMGL